MITLTVKQDGGETYDVTAHARDVLTFEKATGGKKTFLDVMANPDMTSLYRLAHLASWRQGLYTGTLQEFEASCDVVFEEEDPDPDPIGQAPSIEPASPSPSEPASPRPSGRKRATKPL